MLGSLRADRPNWSIAVITPEQSAFLVRIRALGCQADAVPFPAHLAEFGEVSAGRGAATVRAAIAASVHTVRLRRVLRHLAPDVVHAHGIKMQVLSRWVSPRRARVVWHLHDYLAGRPSSARALRASRRRCGAAIANSHSVAEDFRAQVGSQPDVSVIYNAIDIDRFAPEGRRLDLDALARLPAAPDGTLRIGLPATFGRWKGQDVFLRALSLLPPGLPWRGYIIGGAVYRTQGSQWSDDALRALAREPGVCGRVGFTGLVDDMPAAMRSLDVVVHASTQPEPFGMTIAEAMSCGRAAVVAQGGGAAEIIRDGIDAACYPPGDHAALARTLSILLADRERRLRLATAARCSAVTAFDARRLGPQLRAVYESVLLAH